MPLTPSHAVVALPFLRSPLVPAAIAVGAMSPDLPLFVRGLPLTYGVTHSFVWLPVTIVVAFVLLLVWRCVLRPAVRDLSPRWLGRRLPGEWDAGAAASLRETFALRVHVDRTGSGEWCAGERPSWLGALLLLASLALGILTHIVWDLFTHEGRWGAEVLPVLEEQWGPLAGFKWLQHGSSVLGLVVLAVAAALWLRGRDASASASGLLPEWIRWAWWLSLPAILGVAWVAGLVVFGPPSGEWTAAHLAYRVLPRACALWGLLTVLLAVAVQIVRARRSLVRL